MLKTPRRISISGILRGGFPFRGLVGTFGVGPQRARPDIAMTFDELTRGVQVERLVTRARACAFPSSPPRHVDVGQIQLKMIQREGFLVVRPLK